MCVQRFDDSLDSAIHITYRVSLRSSSMREPRDPLLKVLKSLDWFGQKFKQVVLVGASGRLTDPRQAAGVLPKQNGRFHGGLMRRPGRSFPPHRFDLYALQFRAHAWQMQAGRRAPTGVPGGSRFSQSAGAKLFNDPSAGSPTETLLRLLLPLNDQV
jgi:hypothetical protein